MKKDVKDTSEQDTSEVEVLELTEEQLAEQARLEELAENERVSNEAWESGEEDRKAMRKDIENVQKQMQTYSKQNWYWFVGGDTTRVFSSSRMAYVLLTDKAYQKFLKGGNLTSTNPAHQDLLDVLS